MIRVALRFDDPSSTSDVALEVAVLHALAESAIPATVAVVPFRLMERQRIALDAARAGHLIRARAAGTIEVALHGNCHEALPGEPPSEFRGLPSLVQYDKLAEGLQHLRSIFGDVTTGFVPPFNSYDHATVECVGKLGLKYLSAGWDTSQTGDLVYLPRTCQTHALRDAIAEARRLRRLSPIVIPVLHHFDFRESGSPGPRLDLASFRTLLAWLAGQPDVQMLTLGTLATQLSSTMTRNALHRRMRFRHLPWRIQSRLPQQCMTVASWPRMAYCALLD